jgi:hypothetical protein
MTINFYLILKVGSYGGRLRDINLYSYWLSAFLDSDEMEEVDAVTWSHKCHHLTPLRSILARLAELVCAAPLRQGATPTLLKADALIVWVLKLGKNNSSSLPKYLT